MAGQGKTTFIAGNILTASQVNDFLMDQSVMVFSGTAARGSAIPEPSEGMMSYLSDVNSVQMAIGTATYVNVDGVPIVAGTAERAALYPSPVMGNTVFRTDVGITEVYYSLYNASTNPGGAKAAGWYPAPGSAMFHGTASRSATSGSEFAVGSAGYLYTELVDSLAWHSAVTNTDRIVPTVAGLYRVSATVQFGTNAVGSRTILFRKNAVEVARSTQGATPPTGSFVTSMNGTTDYVVISVFQDSGSSLTAAAQVSVEFLKPTIV